MKAYTGADMRSADRYTIDVLGVPGTVLMDRAARTIFDALEPYLFSGKRFVILCGKGNNGGDGYALALQLCGQFESVTCICALGEPTTSDALYFYKKCKCEERTPVMIDAESDISEAEKAIADSDVIVDAIFGTGFNGEIDEKSTVARLIDLSNKADSVRASADIPSGVSVFGGASKITFKADITVTFAKAKPGLFSYPAREYCGRIIVSDIGIPESAFNAMGKKYEISDVETVKGYLPERPAVSSKGTFGRLLAVCGCSDMPGALHLAVSGALRCGAGLVCAASDKEALASLKCRLSEPIYLTVDDSDEATDRLIEYSQKCSAVLIGCGLGTGEAVKSRVERLIRECSCPIILDADGINAVKDNINILTEAKSGILLTPHPLEFSRISGLSLSEISESRLEAAEKFSTDYGCTLLLKGAGTVIADKGERTCINTTGSSALAKGGSGDVLAGMIASFTASGVPLYESAVIGAYLHGAAGDELSRIYSEFGVLPSEIPEAAAKILSKIASED